MTEKEAAIVMAYTGIIMGSMSVFHKYAEELVGHSIFTHEFANKYLMDKIKKLSKQDFINIKIENKDE